MEKFLEVNVKLPAPVETGALISASFSGMRTASLARRSCNPTILHTRLQQVSLHPSINPKAVL